MYFRFGTAICFTTSRRQAEKQRLCSSAWCLLGMGGGELALGEHPGSMEQAMATGAIAPARRRVPNSSETFIMSRLQFQCSSSNESLLYSSARDLRMEL